MFKKFFLVFAISLISIFGFSGFALAEAVNQDNFGISQVGQDLVIGTQRSLPDIVVGLINTALGFLGLIAVILILYAGFLWMTAGGNEERVKKAKETLKNAIIGLIIIFASYAIVAFIFRTFQSVTTGG